MGISKDGDPIDVRFPFFYPQNLDQNKFPLVCKSVAEAADTQYSYVMVATKAIPELVQTSELLEPLRSLDYVARFSQPTYVLLQNGLNVEVDLYNSLKALGRGEPSIISTAVWIATNLLAPNVVEHSDFVSVPFHLVFNSQFALGSCFPRGIST
jgi:2-dehydropantoate 2-reductase